MADKEGKNEIKNSEEYENFTAFVKRVLKVPKSKLDDVLRKERSKRKEENKDLLAEKQPGNS